MVRSVRARMLWLACALASMLSACGGGSSESTSTDPAKPYSLRVQPFGSGTVQASDGSIACGSTCAANYAADASVTLTATAAANWQLHHWSGCDSVSEDLKCSVRLAGHRSVYPVFATTDATLKAGVKVFDATAMAGLDSTTGSTYVFTAGSTAAAALVAGDIFVSQTGNGHARRVQSVSSATGTPIFVTTTEASLSEVLDPGTVIYNTPLTQAQLASATSLLKGAKLRQSRRAAANDFAIDINSSVSGLAVTGTVTLGFTPDFAVNVSTDGVEQFRSAMNTSASASLSMDASASVSAASTTVPLYAFTFSPVLAGPVVLVPRVTVNLVLNGSTEAAFTTSVSYTEAVLLGAEYNAGRGWSTVRGEQHSYSSVPPTLTGAMNASATIASTANISIYGVAGPYARVDSYVKGEASAKATATEGCVDWGLYAGLDGSVGVSGKIIKWSLPDYSAQVFDLQWTVASGKSASCDDKEPPSVPTGLSVAALSPTELRLTWQAATDNVRVAGYRIQRAAQDLGQTSASAYADTGLAAATRYCYRVVAVDPSGNASAASEEACGTTLPAQDTSAPTAPAALTATTYSSNSIDLQWTASQDNVGVAGYVLLRGGYAVQAIAADTLTTRDTGLNAGQSYCYRVIAYDRAGNMSPASPEACASTSTSGAWDVYVKCEGRPYQIKFNLDMDAGAGGVAQTQGSGTDYPGTPLTYVLAGVVDSATRQLDGQITWAFQGNSCIRKDTFSASLATTDSGDVVANQVSVCGCTINVRFRGAGLDPLSAVVDRMQAQQAFQMFSRAR